MSTNFVSFGKNYIGVIFFISLALGIIRTITTIKITTHNNVRHERLFSGSPRILKPQMPNIRGRIAMPTVQ